MSVDIGKLLLRDDDAAYGPGVEVTLAKHNALVELVEMLLNQEITPSVPPRNVQNKVNYVLDKWGLK